MTATVGVKQIKAILFDMNGTLRQRIPDETWQRQSVEQLFTMLGRPAAPLSFMNELIQRYKTYVDWADEHEQAISEADIWTRWVTPELPPEKIGPQATELMVVFRNCKGRYVLKPNAAHVIQELSKRGYRLGLISNTTSTADVPRFIAAWGLAEYFETVVLSSVCGYRKPRPEIFWQATRTMRLKPAQCAYLGNKISSDVLGSRNAGLGLALVLESPNKPLQITGDADKPDAIIHQLGELLDIFPARNNPR